MHLELRFFDLKWIYLRVGLGQRTAVLDEFQEPGGVLGLLDAGGAAAEGGEFPAVPWLDGGASGRRETHSGEVCNRTGEVKYLYHIMTN